MLLPSYVCSAPLHAIHYTGATPVFVDVDPETGNIDPSDLKRRLTPKSKAVVAVHLFGMVADMESILSMGISVLEDCAQALGAGIGPRRAGALGHMSITSFYATKLMTTGEGGMVFSGHEPFMSKARDLAEYDKRDDFRVRFNYKMTDIEAAMGRCQLAKLDAFLEKRIFLARAYDEWLGPLPCRLPPSPDGRVYHRYVIGIDGNVQDIIDKLNNRGIEAARPIFRPLHTYFGLAGYPGAEKCWKQHLSLPLHPGLCVEDIEEICGALEGALEETGK